MYWSPGTRSTAIANVMALARFEKIKCVIHVNDNAQMLKQGEKNVDILYKVH